MTKITPAILVFALASSGCESGYTYRPMGPKGKRLEQWSETVTGVRFAVDPYSTLTGSTNGFFRLEVTNESPKEVLVLGGRLVPDGASDAKAIDAQVSDTPEGREQRTIPAGTTKSVGLLVEFGGPASSALGDIVLWVWRVRIGDREHALKVFLTRKKWA